MNIRTKVTVLGILAGVSVMAFAFSTPCSRRTTGFCGKNWDPCYWVSPNCGTNVIRGTIEEVGQRTIVTPTSNGGYDAWEYGTLCTNVCYILDCQNQMWMIPMAGELPNLKREKGAKYCH